MFEQPNDFREECDAMYRLLKPLADADFERATRFKSWTINDVLTHLHMWNWAVDQSLTNEAAFVAFLGGLRDKLGVQGGLRAFENEWIRGLKGQALLETWRTQYQLVADHFSAADPKARLKWAGPDMSARSSITARLMETWAHGQAVYDVLGVERVDGDRIRNIAVLGINTFGWTHTVHGEPVPPAMPHVRLTGPSGEVWTWNEPSATELIEGSATEFCQVVAQTRNVADTTLKVVDPVATHWMSIAQCFAGPPETPPAPGVRRREAVSVKPRLVYFDFSGSRGEECRIALHLAGIDFDDVRIPRADWPALKPTMPFGSMPVLELPGRPPLAQSNAILVYIGRLHGLHPADAFEAARHEALMCAAEDLRHAILPTMRMTDPEQVRKAREALAANEMKTWGSQVERQLGEGPFVAGAKLQVADLKLYMVVRWLTSGSLDHVPPEVLSHCPKLLRLAKAVGDHEGVKGWVGKKG